MTAPAAHLEAVDLLEKAGSITRFLADIAPLLHDQGPNIGLSERGASGLYHILCDVETMIEDAAARI